MPVLFGEKREDGKVVVGQIQYKIESHPNGYSIDKVPDYPEPEIGKDNIMLYDSKSKEISFEQKERPLTKDEKQEKILEELLVEMKKIRELLEK